MAGTNREKSSENVHALISEARLRIIGSNDEWSDSMCLTFGNSDS